VAVTPFSHFSAVSELFVTAGVFYFFWRAMRRDDFRWAFIAIVVAFETLFNITYMFSRLAQHQVEHDHSAWATALLAGHGGLSFLMFVGLIAFVTLAFRARHVEKTNYFLAHRALTWTFLVLWTLSVASGEAIYALQLSGALQI
jgi:hypothetical protein